MAFVYEKNGKWFLRYKNVENRWETKSSHAHNKTEAKALVGEMQRAIEQERIGIRSAGATMTVKQLFEWWLEAYSSQGALHYKNTSAVRAHIFSHSIASVTLRELSPGHIENLVQEKSRTHAPRTVNGLRTYFIVAINCAKRAGKFKGENPATQVKPRKIPRATFDYLRTNEVAPVLEALHPRFRPLFAVAIYTGLRKGELLALRKTDADLDSRLLTVARSGDRDTSKGGHADVIPIAAEAIPYFEAAIKKSPSELVFPMEDGSMRRDDSRLVDVLRRALGRAGIVQAYEHRCRRHQCGFKERHTDKGLRRCPTHNSKLWPKAIVRNIRFHDLRHTTASLLMMAGSNLAAVQRIMRHSDPKMTTQVYGHLSPDYLRDEIDRLKFGLETERLLATPTAHVTQVLPASENGKKAPTRASPTTENEKDSKNGPNRNRTCDLRIRRATREIVRPWQTFASA